MIVFMHKVQETLILTIDNETIFNTVVVVTRKRRSNNKFELKTKYYNFLIKVDFMNEYK